MYAIQLDLFTEPEQSENVFITQSLAVLSDKQDRQRRAFFGHLGRLGTEQNDINEQLYALRTEVQALRKQLEMVTKN